MGPSVVICRLKAASKPLQTEFSTVVLLAVGQFLKGWLTCNKGNLGVATRDLNITTTTTKILTKYLKKNLEAIPGKHLIDSLQKSALLGTSHVIWKV